MHDRAIIRNARNFVVKITEYIHKYVFDHSRTFFTQVDIAEHDQTR